MPLPKEYDIILDGLESRLCFFPETDDKYLTIEDIHEKLSKCYKKLKIKQNETKRDEALIAQAFGQNGLESYQAILKKAKEDANGNKKKGDLHYLDKAIRKPRLEKKKRRYGDIIRQACLFGKGTEAKSNVASAEEIF